MTEEASGFGICNARNEYKNTKIKILNWVEEQVVQELLTEYKVSADHNAYPILLAIWFQKHRRLLKERENGHAEQERESLKAFGCTCTYFYSRQSSRVVIGHVF